eukprot:247489-Ditylum_brightwellii.AAC.1
MSIPRAVLSLFWLQGQEGAYWNVCLEPKKLQSEIQRHCAETAVLAQCSDTLWNPEPELEGNDKMAGFRV